MGKINLIGKRFGKLTVIEEASKIVYATKSTKLRWLCRCDCGGNTIATTADLKRGHTLSCGCYQKQKNYRGINKTRHATY